MGLRWAGAAGDGRDGPFGNSIAQNFGRVCVGSIPENRPNNWQKRPIIDYGGQRIRSSRSAWAIRTVLPIRIARSRSVAIRRRIVSQTRSRFPPPPRPCVKVLGFLGECGALPAPAAFRRLQVAWLCARIGCRDAAPALRPIWRDPSDRRWPFDRAWETPDRRHSAAALSGCPLLGRDTGPLRSYWACGVRLGASVPLAPAGTITGASRGCAKFSAVSADNAQDAARNIQPVGR